MPFRFRAAAGVVLTLVILGLGGGASVRAAPAEVGADARSVVEGFHARLLEVMKNAKVLGIKGRYERLAPEIERRFNVRLMVAIATGAFWRTASAAERDRLTAAFARFSAATYASNFSSFSGQSFSTDAVTPGPRGTMLVLTHISRPDEAPVKLAYVTRPTDGQWRIVDVLVDDGISELARRRSEYRSILGSRGVEGLVAELNRGADRLLAR